MRCGTKDLNPSMECDPNLRRVYCEIVSLFQITEGRDSVRVGLRLELPEDLFPPLPYSPSSSESVISHACAK
jgi:hypothetical protein